MHYNQRMNFVSLFTNYVPLRSNMKFYKKYFTVFTLYNLFCLPSLFYFYLKTNFVNIERHRSQCKIFFYFLEAFVNIHFTSIFWECRINKSFKLSCDIPKMIGYFNQPMFNTLKSHRILSIGVRVSQKSANSTEH